MSEEFKICKELLAHNLNERNQLVFYLVYTISYDSKAKVKRKARVKNNNKKISLVIFVFFFFKSRKLAYIFKKDMSLRVC